MYARRLIFAYLFLIALSIGAVYISGIYILVSLWGGIIMYSILLYVLQRIWRMIRPRPYESFIHFFITFIYRVSLSFSIFFLVFGSFIIFQNIISPVKLPNYTLSNGDKTIVFQTMSHIASENFYAKVQKNILQAKKDGFVFFYEGVRPGSKENTQDFNKALGIDFAPGLYKNLSKLYGVVAQDNSYFLNIWNNKDYNIDLSLDEIMTIYRKKTPLSQEKKSLLNDPKIQNINAEILMSLESLNPKELLVIRIVNQSILNFMVKHEGIRNKLIKSLGKEDLFTVILNDRNKNLVQEIKKSRYKNIYITYGLMHFDGVFKRLQEADSNWSIIDEDSIQMIRN